MERKILNMKEFQVEMKDYLWNKCEYPDEDVVKSFLDDEGSGYVYYLRLEDKFNYESVRLTNEELFYLCFYLADTYQAGRIHESELSEKGNEVKL